MIIVPSSVWRRPKATFDDGLGKSPGKASVSHEVNSATEKLPDTRI